MDVGAQILVCLEDSWKLSLVGIPSSRIDLSEWQFLWLPGLLLMWSKQTATCIQPSPSHCYTHSSNLLVSWYFFSLRGAHPPTLPKILRSSISLFFIPPCAYPFMVIRSPHAHLSSLSPSRFLVPPWVSDPHAVLPSVPRIYLRCSYTCVPHSSLYFTSLISQAHWQLINSNYETRYYLLPSINQISMLPPCSQWGITNTERWPCSDLL